MKDVALYCNLLIATFDGDNVHVECQTDTITEESERASRSAIGPWNVDGNLK